MYHTDLNLNKFHPLLTGGNYLFGIISGQKAIFSVYTIK